MLSREQLQQAAADSGFQVESSRMSRPCRQLSANIRD